MGEYDEYPEHPLCGIDPAVLEVAREVLREAAKYKDVDPDLAEGIADAVVARLRTAGYLREGAQ